MSQGTPTVYEAVYPEMIAFLKDNAGLDYIEEDAALVREASIHAGHMDIDEAEDMAAARSTIAEAVGADPERLAELMEPLEDIYAIADHCRTLAYMLGDEIVPSNVGTGYLARMVLRKTKRLVDGVGVDAPLDELVDMQAERLGYENRDHVWDVVRTEVEKYRDTLERGSRKVEQLAEEYAETGEPIPTGELVELYDSHGIQPDMVEEIAVDHGAAVEVPDDFYAVVAERHEAGQAFAGTADEHDERIEDLPETDRLYYEDQAGTEFEAVVLDVFDARDGVDACDVVLDGTMFYPEGGGQPADHGTLSSDDRTVQVTDVQRRDGVVLHRTDDPIDEGELVRGKIDVARRRRHMQHHTATHVVGHAARQVLGDHVRQAGAQKSETSARLDLTHHRRIDPEQVTAIERVANEIVRENVPVSQEWTHRNEAEGEHGFDIYQGGIPAGEEIRLIHAGEDTQACGGTHVARTGDVGAIKILRTERVQDGVERLTYAAGDAAIEATQETEDALYAAAEVLDVDPQEVPETAERFFEEWKERGKRIDELNEEVAELKAAADDGTEVDVGDATAVVRRLDAGMDELRATANALVDEGKIAVLGSGTDGATFVVAVPDDAGVDAGEVVGELAARVGGGGGGPPDFAQGGGPDAARLDDALEDAPDVLRQVRNA
jgi:alanyl-tRNA synthetase